MKPNRKNRILLASLTFALTLATPSAFAANLYWDTNGTGAAGSGAATGTWGTSVFWSTDSTGANVGSPVLTATTTGVDDLFFSAGTNGTGGTVTVNSTRTARLLTLEEGALTFSGGTISLAGGGGITVNSGTGTGNAIISSNLTFSGNNIINVGSSRTLTLNTGTFTRSAGATLSILGGGIGSSTMSGLSVNDATGIIGTWASAGSGTGTTFAKFSGSSFSGLSYTGAADGTAAAASTDVSSTLGTVNYNLNAAGTLGANANINTLRWGGAAGALATSTTFTTKGIMNGGTGLLSFSGAVTSGAAGTEMVVNTANADIDFNGAFTGTITKTGSGTMTLGNVAHSVGGITVNQGILISDGSGITGNSTVNSGGTLLATKAAALPGYNLASRVSVLNGATLAVRAGGTGEWISSEIDSLLGATTAAFASGSNLGVEVTASNSFTYANNIGATQAAKGLTKSGAGTLILSGANTYTGGTAITAGTLKLSGTGTPGAAGSSVAVSSGALLDLNGTNQSIAFTAGTGVGTVANNAGSGTSTLTLSASPAANVIIADNTNSSTGKVAVVVAVDSSSLSATNTYSGGTTVNAGAFLYVNGAVPLSAGTGTITLTANGGTRATSSGLVVDGATYANDITGAGYVHINGASAAKFTGNLTTSGQWNFRTGTTGSYEFAGNGTTSVLSGVIGSTTNMVNGAVVTGRIIKSGSGTLTLSGANTFTGGVTINAGTLTLANAGALNSTAGSENAVAFGDSSTGTLALGGNSVVIRSLNSNATPGTPVVENANGGNATLTIGNALNLASTYAGTIQNGTGGGTLALTKAGTNTLTLSGTNTYTGATSVSAGTLYVTGALTNSAVTVQAAGAIGGSGTLGAGLFIAAGGKLDITGASLGSNSSGILSITGGTLTLGNLTFGDLVGWDASTAAPGTYELIDGAFTTNFGSTAFISPETAFEFANGNKGYFTSGSLNAVIIPEPSALLLGSIGLLALLRRRSRQP